MSHNEINEVVINPEQEAKLSTFIGAHPEASRKLALRFLIGRKWEMERVERLYSNYKKTVQEKDLGCVTLQDVLDEMRTQKMYLPGSRARDQSALFVIWATRHAPGVFTAAQTLKLAFYLNQVGVGEDLVTQQKGLCILVNLEGMQWANSDVGFLKGIIDFFTDNIPAAVKHIVVWRAPWWISMLAKMVLPFMKEKMRNRVLITDDSAKLLEVIEVEQLPCEFPGGKFAYDHARHIEVELAKISMAQQHLQTATFTTSPQPQEPDGVEYYIPEELATKLWDERRQHFEELRLKVKSIRTTLQSGHAVPIQAAWLGATKRGRLSLDPMDIDRLYLPMYLHDSGPEEKRQRIIPAEGDRVSEGDLGALIASRMQAEWQARNQQLSLDAETQHIAPDSVSAPIAAGGEPKVLLNMSP